MSISEWFEMGLRAYLIIWGTGFLSAMFLKCLGRCKRCGYDS